MKSKKLKQLISKVMIATTIAATIPAINPTVAFATSSDVTYATVAQAGAAGFVVRLINGDAEYEISMYSGTSTAVTVPSQINGKRVTSIGDSAFNSCSNLTSITIPNSVTSIGSGAFNSCSRLTSITIPSSITSIGATTFLNCSSLTSITIPNSVTSIGNSAFYGCSGLTSITIPNSVTTIGMSAFASINTNARFYVARQSLADSL